MELARVSDDGNVLRLQAKGCVKQDAAMAELEPMGALLGGQGYSRKILLDMSEADFVDSSGLSWLLVCHKRFRQAGGKVVLHSVPLVVMQVLRVLCLDRAFDLADDEPAALSLLTGDSA